MVMDPGDNYLIDLLREGEADRVEFKESLGGDAREKLRQAICSFANDLPGYGQPGVAYVGVKDDRTVIGTSVDDESIRTLADMKTDGNILPPPHNNRAEVGCRWPRNSCSRRGALRFSTGTLKGEGTHQGWSTAGNCNGTG